MAVAPQIANDFVFPSFSLLGKSAFVTGGSRGIGRACALTLAAAGADVAVGSSPSGVDAAEAVCQEIRDMGRRSQAYAFDVATRGDVETMCGRVNSEFDTVDILINNAGVNLRGPAELLPESDWDQVIDVNLKAPFLVARRLGPAMCAHRWGRVINMGSILSVIGIPHRAPYAAAKAGLLNLTRVLALEWAPHGVTVNALCPGPFATDMNKPLLDDPEKYSAFVAKIPLGRWGELHEIAGPALFLASDASSFVTGSALFVDGGWTAQ